MTADQEHDLAGWHNTCMRKVADGSYCGLRYWYAWVPSAGRGKRFTDRESGQPHSCREVGI